MKNQMPSFIRWLANPARLGLWLVLVVEHHLRRVYALGLCAPATA